MSFGTAATLDDVPSYLASVRGGRPAPDELVVEFQRRFARVGGSPLTRITLEQARALEAELHTHDGHDYHVAVGMRHAPPMILEGLSELLNRGATRVIALIMSPQYSPLIMGGYLKALESARSVLVDNASRPEFARFSVAVAEDWHDEPMFVQAMADRVRETLDGLDARDRGNVQVLFTAHSLPRSVADREPGYLIQLQDTAERIAEAVGLPSNRWQFAYQSAGHTPEPWLTPDVKDLLPDLRREGHSTVIVAPVQFLADHLEVLYDIDVAAREEAAALGIRLVRTASLNTMPTFIRALAEVVRRT